MCAFALTIPDLANSHRMLLSGCCVDDEFVFQFTAHSLWLKHCVCWVLRISVFICMGQLLHVVVAPAK